MLAVFLCAQQAYANMEAVPSQLDANSSSSATGLGGACSSQVTIVSWSQIRCRLVDAKLDLTLTHPVELAKLWWALHGYQAQLQREKQGEAAAQQAAAAELRRQEVQDERAAAKRIVREVYRRCKAGHDVHIFMQQLCSYYPMLDVDKLGDKPSGDRDSAEWKSSMGVIIGKAMLQVHPDKAAVGTPRQEGYALEMFDVLVQWKSVYA